MEDPAGGEKPHLFFAKLAETRKLAHSKIKKLFVLLDFTIF